MLPFSVRIHRHLLKSPFDAIVGGRKTGMKVSAACPKDYRPPKEILEFAMPYGDRFLLCEDPFQAAKGADVLVTAAFLRGCLIL